MNEPDKKLWHGLDDKVRGLLRARDYKSGSLAECLAGAGIEAGELVEKAGELRAGWIPGVEIFRRTIHPQRHRGAFGEFVRRDEGILKTIGLWPAQWSAARMFAGTAKGFHIHPPSVPNGRDAGEWFQSIYGNGKENYRDRPYEKEQWDVMFFVQGSVEMLLADERAGMERRTMRFIIEGDDLRGPNNAAVVIPAGVAHALRVESSRDLIMVYGTSTSFDPNFEGRIASEVENAPLPNEWEEYLKG